MTPKFHAIATLGTFTDKATGKKVKRYLTVGTVFESPNGKLFMRCDAQVVSPDWSGFLSFREISRSSTTEPATDEETEEAHDEAGPF
jgi:hypothetical protein